MTITKTISVVASCARIFATVCIFIYHGLGQLGLNNHGLDFIAILIFCFLSGYLHYGNEVQPLEWFYKRVFSIMLPYWFVIVPAVTINRMVLYKGTSVVEDLITVFGGNLFLKNPVYVIGWYITFILILYLILFAILLLKRNKILQFMTFIFCIFYFGIKFNMLLYCVSFIFGYILTQLFPLSKKELSENGYIGKLLFALQSRCYAFFLIHGGVLIFLTHYSKFNSVNFFLVGAVVSCIGAEILYRVTKPLIPKAVNTALNLKTMLLRSIA